MKKIMSTVAILGLGILLSGCSKWIDRGESITAVGSSALQPLVETAAASFQTEHPGKFVNVQGGGSGTGLSQVLSGAVEIGNSDLFAEEKKGIDPSELVDFKVAVVGITPIVHPEVGVSNITLDELRDLFSGKIENWKELGGIDAPVVLLNRAVGSGTRNTFETWVMRGEHSKQSQEQDSSGMVRQIVSKTPGAISYVAFSYVNDDVATLSIDQVAPTVENVVTNRWVLWSYEHMYTKGEPTELTKEFIDYMLSPEVQDHIVEKLGYIPISQMKVTRDWQGKIIPR